jgi:hypothetical protein
MNRKTVLVILSVMLILVIGLSSCIISPPPPPQPTPSSPNVLSSTQVPNASLDVYIYARQSEPSVIPAEMVGAPCDIEVESCAVWGVPAGDDFALGMGLTLTTADCASKLYAAINFQEYGWKMLSGSTIYFVHGSGTAADILKRAIANHDFKYYDDTESIKAVGDLPNSSTTRPAAIAVVKPSKELIGFIGRYADPRYFDQVNTTLSQLNLKLIVVGLYSPSHIDIAKIAEIIEGGGSISGLNLGLLMSVESNHPGFLVEPAVMKFLIDSGFTEMNFAGVTIYKGDLDRYVGETIPALVWIKGNRVFAALAGQESYTQNLISLMMAHALPSPPPVPTPAPTPSSNLPPQIFSLVANPSGILYGGSTILTCAATDPDGDMVRYTWTASEGSITGVGNRVTWTAPNRSGEYNITVIVSDGKGGSVQASVPVTVSANQAPIISGLVANPSGVPYGGSTTLTCIASDPDGDVLRYTWSAREGSIAGVGNKVSWIAPNKGGSYDITVIVSDGKGEETKGNVMISVSAQLPQHQLFTIDMLANFQLPDDIRVFPIYIKSNQRLHFTFSVTQGQAAFWFKTPTGKNIRLNTAGNLVETNLHDGEFIQLGNVIFKPSDYGWGEGDYEMTFGISDIGENLNGENKAQVQVEYWIED